MALSWNPYTVVLHCLLSLNAENTLIATVQLHTSDTVLYLILEQKTFSKTMLNPKLHV